MDYFVERHRLTAFVESKVSSRHSVQKLRQLVEPSKGRAFTPLVCGVWSWLSFFPLHP